MLKLALMVTAVLAATPVLASSESSDDVPVRCRLPIAEANYWQSASAWAPLTRQFTDRTAAWVSLTPAATVRGAPACEGLGEGRRQVISVAFNNPRVGYFTIQALSSDRLVVRIRDAFDYPLFEIHAEAGDFTGTMVAQTVRLSDGDFKLELESGSATGANASAAGVIASLADKEGTILVNTAYENSCGRYLSLK